MSHERVTGTQQRAIKVLIGKANNVSMYIEPSSKIHDYIKEVKNYPIDRDVEMEDEDTKHINNQLSGSKPDKEMHNSDSVHGK